jgi:hypothetical protein
MPEMIQRADNAKSKIRARVEHVLAEQKDQMGLFIRTIGIARVTTKIGIANLVYKNRHLIFPRDLAITATILTVAAARRSLTPPRARSGSPPGRRAAAAPMRSRPRTARSAFAAKPA